MSVSNTIPQDHEEGYALYCLLSGGFFHAYTALEHELNCAIVVAITRLSNARRAAPLIAVLGGQRMSPAKDTIKRLMRATRASQKRRDFVDSVFHQLGEIQFLRDRLSHHLTIISDDNAAVWVNTNFAGIRELHQMEDISFSLEVLRHATTDLVVIRSLVESFFNHYVRRGSAATPPLPSWLYKPSMLIRDRPISNESQRRRKRPPPPSQA